jgi:hypothetical protein
MGDSPGIILFPKTVHVPGRLTPLTEENRFFCKTALMVFCKQN